MGEIGSDARMGQYLPLSLVRAQLQRRDGRSTRPITDRRAGAILRRTSKPAGGSA